MLEESQEVRRADADKAEESAGWRCGDWGSQGWEGYAGMENITLLRGMQAWKTSLSWTKLPLMTQRKKTGLDGTTLCH